MFACPSTHVIIVYNLDAEYLSDTTTKYWHRLEQADVTMLQYYAAKLQSIYPQLFAMALRYSVMLYVCTHLYTKLVTQTVKIFGPNLNEVVASQKGISVFANV